MPASFLSGINLNKTEIRNVVIHLLATAPSSPTEGQIYYNTTDHRLYFRTNATWQDITDSVTLNGQNAAYYLSRANHTGTQTASTISDFNSSVDARITTANLQPRDTDLDQIAAINSSNDDIIQKKSGSWTNRTPAQLKVDLALVKADVGLGNVDNTSDATKFTNTPLTGVPTAPTASPGTNTTQLATTAFTVAEITSRIASMDVMQYKGAIDASTNPNYPAANAGDTYRISVGGKIGGASGVNVEAGDMIIAFVDGSSSGTQAAVGANWNIIQLNIDGAVTLTGTQTLTNKTLTSPIINSPSGLVKADVGLGNVDNTSDATKNSATVTLTNKTLTSPVINTASKELVTSLTEETGIASGDFVIIYDVSADALRKITRNNFIAGLVAGAVTKYSTTIGDGTSTSYVITQATHGRASDHSNQVQVQVASTGEVVIPDVTVNPSNGNITISFATAPTSNQYRVNIFG